MSPLFIVLVFLATVVALEGAGLMVGLRRGKKERVRHRLRKLASKRIGETPRASGSLIRTPGGVQLADSGLARTRGALNLLLYRAGMPMSVFRLLLLSALFAALGWVIGNALFVGKIFAPFALAAGVIPLLLVKRAARRRMIRFEEQLPDALELLTRALRAGHAVGTGLQLVGEEMGDPVGTEFSIVAEELRFGLELRDALRNLMARIENPDLPYFATAVLIQRQTGGNLAEILDNLGGLLRERSQFHGRVRALTAQGRGAALVLALWLPVISVLVYYSAPNYFQPLIENTWGHMVLTGVAVIDVGSYLIARKIADVVT